MLLEPYRVLDFTDDRGQIGPMLMGDLGADVIRIEPPGGSGARTAEPRLDNADTETMASLPFLAFNRNKRSLTLDPASSSDRASLEALITRSQFIFEPWPESPLAAYDIDYETARQLNPRVIFVRMSPWGVDGPHADYLGNDLVLAAMGGPVALQGSNDRAPVRLSVPQVWRHAGAEAAVAAMVARTLDQFGRLDIVVSNAGVLFAGDITEFPADRWRLVLDVNLYGYFLVAKYAARPMKAQKSGSIIQINSKSGKKGSYKNSAYAASKGGLNALAGAQ